MGGHDCPTGFYLDEFESCMPCAPVCLGGDKAPPWRQKNCEIKCPGYTSTTRTTNTIAPDVSSPMNLALFVSPVAWVALLFVVGIAAMVILGIYYFKRCRNKSRRGIDGERATENPQNTSQRIRHPSQQSYNDILVRDDQSQIQIRAPNASQATSEDASITTAVHYTANETNSVSLINLRTSGDTSTRSSLRHSIPVPISDSQHGQAGETTEFAPTCSSTRFPGAASASPSPEMMNTEAGIGVSVQEESGAIGGFEPNILEGVDDNDDDDDSELDDDDVFGVRLIGPTADDV